MHPPVQNPSLLPCPLATNTPRNDSGSQVRLPDPADTMAHEDASGRRCRSRGWAGLSQRLEKTGATDWSIADPANSHSSPPALAETAGQGRESSLPGIDGGG